jgi:hypothetical protein
LGPEQWKFIGRAVVDLDPAIVAVTPQGVPKRKRIRRKIFEAEMSAPEIAKDAVERVRALCC